MRRAITESIEYSPRAAEYSSDMIDYLIPPFYYRKPLPLQEPRSFGMIYENINLDNSNVQPKERIEILFEENDKNDTKQNLLKSLVGQPEYYNSMSLLLKSELKEEDTVASRLKGKHCDASHIISAKFMAQLLSLILSNRSNLNHQNNKCITSIDMSHTFLGPVGPNGPPLNFDMDGNSCLNKIIIISSNKNNKKSKKMIFFPDEVQKRTNIKIIKQSKVDDITKRSLALAYMVPLLWMTGNTFFQIKELTCQDCNLEDRDAKAIAFILRKRSSKKYSCILQYIDLSYNNITDIGAEALKKAIKYNINIESLKLDGNNIKKIEILKKIEKRLNKNQKGKSNLTLLQHFKWVLLGE